jgi:GGDEF domain-containing protein
VFADDGDEGLGGDEFVLIVMADSGGAEVLARRIQSGFHARSPWDSTLSVGLVEWDGAAHAGDLINTADGLMYQNKHMARGAESRPARPA